MRLTGDRRREKLRPNEASAGVSTSGACYTRSSPIQSEFVIDCAHLEGVEGRSRDRAREFGENLQQNLSPHRLNIRDRCAPMSATVVGRCCESSGIRATLAESVVLKVSKTSAPERSLNMPVSLRSLRVSCSMTTGVAWLLAAQIGQDRALRAGSRAESGLRSAFQLGPMPPGRSRCSAVSFST